MTCTATADRRHPGRSGPTPSSTSRYEDWCSFAWELRTCFALFYADRLAFSRGGFGSLGPLGACAAGGVRRPADLRPRRPPAGRRRAGGAPRPEPAVHPGRPGTSESRPTSSPGPASLHLTRRGRPRRDRRMLAPTSLRPSPRARPDDKRSWWTTVDGVDICNRVNYLNEQSAVHRRARGRRAVPPDRGARRSRPARRAGPPRRQQRRDQGPGRRRRAWPTCPGTATAAWAGTRSSARCSTSASSSTRRRPPPGSS